MVFSWYPIEEAQDSRPTASVLAGSQLNWLTNAKYQPGGHRVVALPSSEKYRYSIVFILRAHWPVKIDTDLLTSSVTGPFVKPIKGKPIWDLFREIAGQLGPLQYNQDTTC